MKFKSRFAQSWLKISSDKTPRALRSCTATLEMARRKAERVGRTIHMPAVWCRGSRGLDRRTREPVLERVKRASQSVCLPGDPLPRLRTPEVSIRRSSPRQTVFGRGGKHLGSFQRLCLRRYDLNGSNLFGAGTRGRYTGCFSGPDRYLLMVLRSYPVSRLIATILDRVCDAASANWNIFSREVGHGSDFCLNKQALTANSRTFAPIH